MALRTDAIGANGGSVGVAMTPVPKVDTYLPGAGCLLCLAAASLANSSLTAHARTLGAEDLPKLKTEVAELIRKKGGKAIVIDEELKLDALGSFSGSAPNAAKKDFMPLQRKYGVDKLVVIDLNTVGFVRNYSAYVPTSDPKGTVAGVGYMVNLKDNTYEWYLPVNVTKSADGAWDEPPKFPGLTNSYFQAVEMGRDALLRPFSQ
ncbi:hypothetical protein [Ideonella sp. BN130291]|uniref:hypothetical protein n=1 Tax=Ideonella sp. BN130291 TaxID=3112940 RepID=UPI002E25E2B3|nr:hypothetical protein [Ideonella sp. BN130291]